MLLPLIILAIYSLLFNIFYPEIPDLNIKLAPLNKYIARLKVSMYYILIMNTV